MDNRLKKDIEHCRKIQKKYGKSYYFATRFFPKKQRIATYALYAFFRVPDELVDNGGDNTKAEKNLKKWMANWQMAYKYKEHEDPVLNAASWVFQEYKIPYEYSEAFLNAMLMDLTKKQYNNYSELEKYMYGSAGVVGLIMSHIIGFSDEKALKYALQLGYAMQLTNFLRDIKEDFVLRERIYMPLDELNDYQLTKEDIAAGLVNERFIDFMKFQIKRARELYDSSWQGLPYLNKGGRLAVKTATKLYSAILTEIEKKGFDVYTKRARTSFLRKLVLFFRIHRLSQIY
jgi:phytoene synthase